MTWLRRIARWLGAPAPEPREGQRLTDEPAHEAEDVFQQAAPLPLDGELDLHTFRPSEVAELVEDYVRACQEAGVLSLRIVHGKGKGTLRRTVHARLSRLDAVMRFNLAPPERGGWGATLVDLYPAATRASGKSPQGGPQDGAAT